MSETELLPCPFCGGEAELSKGLCELDNYVMCLECRSKTKLYNTKEAAIKKWNTRKPMERIVERLEKEEVNKAFVGGRSNGKTLQVGINYGIATAIEIVKEEGGLNGTLQENRKTT